MAITGVTPQQYSTYLSQGGTLVFEIDRDDIDGAGAFEGLATLAPVLATGFEIPPSATALADSSITSPLKLGDQWTRTVIFTYRRGGKVTYQRLPTGRYSATATY